MSIHRPLIIATLPTVFGGASDALEAALRFECSREDLQAYEVRPHADGFAVEVYSVDPREPVGFLAEDAEAPTSPLRDALQWLLDDLNDAGETHADDGSIFDSVEAAAALVEAGGALNWYSREDAEAFRWAARRKGQEDAQ